MLSHQVHKRLIDYCLTVIAWQSAFLQLDAHQVVIVVHAGIKSGGEESFTVLTVDETAAVTVQRIAVS